MNVEIRHNVADGIDVLALRTPTLPPATHTNCYLVGRDALTVVDPASPWEDQRSRLLAALMADGREVERIVLTHHHHDHVQGAVALRDALAEHGASVPIAAHARTAELLADQIRVDHIVQAGGAVDCGGVALTAVFTPGHAPGHLAFLEPVSGAVIAGDMVAGVGTIVVDPVDGDLGQYLDSLQLLRDLSPSVLLPAHGDPLTQADAVLAFYVAHRHQRTEQIRQALDVRGVSRPVDLAPIVYPDLPPHVWPLAAIQITSHLIWMVRHGVAIDRGDGLFGP